MAQVRIINARQREVEVSSGAMTRLAGVSASPVGVRGIHLTAATIPPRRRSGAHWHTNCESAIYVTRNHGRFLVGEDLQTSLEFEAGDFIYAPPDALHQPVNDGAEPVEIVREYTDLTAQRAGNNPL